MPISHSANSLCLYSPLSQSPSLAVLQGTDNALTLTAKWQLTCTVFNGLNAKVCSSCHSISYCSSECQKLDWPLHKTICKNLHNLRFTTITFAQTCYRSRNIFPTPFVMNFVQVYAVAAGGTFSLLALAHLLLSVIPFLLPSPYLSRNISRTDTPFIDTTSLGNGPDRALPCN